MRRNAFTLVELLVVTAIVAVLVAMLLPALNKARVQARLLKCLSGARQMHLSVQMYCNDNDYYYPSGVGTAADPVWFITRQWQLGELQGEDASTPVVITAAPQHVPLTYDSARPDLDPTLPLLLSRFSGEASAFSRAVHAGHREYARDTLPTIQHHLAELRRLQK